MRRRNLTFDDGYATASTRVHLTYLAAALQGLGRESAEWTQIRLVAEREDAIATLRRICGEFGDNDWPAELHISDILTKHLEPYLR
jgi:hypothetical protein